MQTTSDERRRYKSFHSFPATSWDLTGTSTFHSHSYPRSIKEREKREQDKMTSSTPSNVENTKPSATAGATITTTSMPEAPSETISPAPADQDAINVYGDALATTDGEDTDNASDNEDEDKSMKRSLLRRAEKSHNSLPGIRKIPLRAIGIIFLIALVNVVVWIAAAIVLVCALLFTSDYGFSTLYRVAFRRRIEMFETFIWIFI